MESKNFSGQNLRGRSFKGQNLEGTDFSGADIRGANFTNAYLKGANFSHAQAGLQRRWAVCLIVVSFSLSMFSGLACGLAGIMTAGIVSPTFLKEYHPVPAGILLVVLIIYYTFVLRRGFIIGLVACALSLAALISIIGTLTGSLAGSGVAALAVAWAVVGTLTGAIAVVIVKAIASSKTLNVFLLSSGIFHQFWAGASAWVVAGIVAGNAIGAKSGEAAVAKSVNVARVVVGAKSVAVAFVGTDIEIACRFFAIGVACSLVFLGIYTGIQALKIDEKDIVIRRIGIFIAAIGGTNFYQANLTNANFREAILKNTNFTHAILERTCFSWVKKLECSRISATYLKDPQIRKLVITGEAQRQSFNRKDMEGLNLRGANLQEASFIGANLSKTNLQEANLFGAKLVKTRLEQTDFTRAILTGAYIEDWGITIDTRLDHVECQYIYMRFPTKEKPNPLRKPDSEKEVFADGDFGDFIKPIVDTLDLYHNQGVDPRAIAISFKNLAENHPEADLRIVGMEVRGEDKFLLRAKTADNANKSELSDEYFNTYNQIKGLSEREIQLLLAEKDSRIRSLENFVNQALQRPSFYSNVEYVGFMTNNPGGFSVGGSVDGNINNIQGNNNRGVQGDTTMTGDRTINTSGGNYNERIQGDYVQGNKYAGQSQSLAEAAAEIQALLKQLEQTYPTATTSEKMVVAAQAVDKIETNPLLKQRVINAIKEGSLAAFEKAIDNPVGAFVVHAIEGWQEVKKD